jgi:hypothetical protein
MPMANDLSARQWNLDTPVAFGNANSILWKGNIKITQIEWSGYVASATVVIKDQNNKIVWTQKADAANLAPIRVGNIGWANGLCLDTLSSGVVTLYTA